MCVCMVNASSSSPRHVKTKNTRCVFFLFFINQFFPFFLLFDNNANMICLPTFDFRGRYFELNFPFYRLFYSQVCKAQSVVNIRWTKKSSQIMHRSIILRSNTWMVSSYRWYFYALLNLKRCLYQTVACDWSWSPQTMKIKSEFPVYIDKILYSFRSFLSLFIEGNIVVCGVLISNTVVRIPAMPKTVDAQNRYTYQQNPGRYLRCP